MYRFVSICKWYKKTNSNSFNMDIHAESKSEKSFSKEKLWSNLPSHILCEILHVIPDQILVRFQWKDKGLLVPNRFRSTVPIEKGQRRIGKGCQFARIGMKTGDWDMSGRLGWRPGLSKSKSIWSPYLVNSPERTDIDGLTTHSTGTSNTGGVLTRSGVDDGINQNLDWVLKNKQFV